MNHLTTRPHVSRPHASRRRHSRWIGASVLSAAVVLGSAAPSQAATDYSTVVATDAVANAGFGKSAAFSNDGSTVVIGTGVNGTDSSAAPPVYVYSNVPQNTFNLVKETQRLTPPSTAGETSSGGFGAGVATSADGRTIAVSAPGTANIYIFTRAAGATTWTYSTKIFQTGATTNLGRSLALSGDGTKLLASGTTATTSTTQTTSAFYFTLVNSTWSLKSQVTDGVAGSNFGSAVALSNDGTTAAISAPKYNTTVSGRKTYQPRATLYSVSATNLTATRQVSDPTNTSYNSLFGTSLALSANGSDVAIGAPGVTSLSGSSATLAGVVFTAGSGTAWALNSRTATSASSFSGEQLGQTVTLSPDGLILGAGAPGTQGRGFYWQRASTTVGFPAGSTGQLVGGGQSFGNGTALTFGPAKRYVITTPRGTYSGTPSQSGFAQVATIVS